MVYISQQKRERNWLRSQTFHVDRNLILLNLNNEKVLQ